MFRFIVYCLFINAVKLIVVEIISCNDLLRLQVSQVTAPYFLKRNDIFLYRVPPASYGGVEWLKLGAACSSEFLICNFYCRKYVITLRVRNRCGGFATDRMNLYNQREICVRNFMISIRISLFVNPFWSKLVLVNVNDRKFQTKQYLI